MIINQMFDALMKGDASVLITDNIRLLNEEALRLMSISELNSDQVEELKKIIMICNVLYNRTDMTVLPIEDGFYDLLLEKYKTYDPNFQVGSAVVEFRNFIENDLDQQTKVAKCPISFDHPQRDEIHQAVFDEIMRKGKPILNKYDFARKMVSFDDKYISKRTHNTQHNHPSLVGTLDKAKFVLNQDAINAGVFNDDNVKVLERDFFQDHIKKGIIHPNQEIGVVVELKYDGISVEADCNLEVQSARTRGDTGIGEAADITPILKGYRFKHAGPLIGDDPIGIKFEAIMTNSNLAKFNQLRGRSYANCRSAIVGLFGSSDAYLYRDLITLVPLAIDREQVKDRTDFTNMDRLTEIILLNNLFTSHGQPLRYCYFSGTVPEILYMIKVFWDEAKVAREYLDFMYDGIVVSYVDDNIRQTLGRKNYINKYSMAVKFDPLEKQTIFRGYTYEVGQHGNITPMIHYDPVEFLGTIHTKSTGSSLNRFKDLGLKYGDYINVKYVNDVMPYVSRVECDHNRNNSNPAISIIDKCPICGADLVVSDSGKSLLCPNMNCQGRSLQRMTNMFAKMNLKGFADATFKALGRSHLYELVNISSNELREKLGEVDSMTFLEALNYITHEPQKDYIVLGALGFTSIAHKKWQSILQYITLRDLYNLYQSCSNLDEFRMMLQRTIPNIGDVTCNTITNEWKFFEKDIEFILNNFNLINSYGVSNEGKLQIRFSGIRNKQLSEQLSTNGYDADDSGSVTKNTDILLIPYEGFSSSKVTKAQKNPNTKIIPIQDFIDNMDKYLN